MELPPLTRIRGVHRHSSLYHMNNDGFFYVRCNESRGTVYFRCSKSGSGCPATAVLNSGQFQSSGHNHLPNPLHVPFNLERERLINEAADLQQYSTFAEIFSVTSNAFPDLLTQHSLQPAMARMRGWFLPLEPSSLRDLDIILSDERYRCVCATSHFEDSIYAGSTVSEDGNFAILLLCSKCKEFMKHAITLFTFTTLFTIEASRLQFAVHVIYTVWDGNFIFLAWILMEQLSVQGFIAALSFLKSKLEVRHFKTVVCQQRSMEANAYTAVFTPVHVTFCLHDFVENVGKWVQSENMNNNPHLIDFASLVCALPMLPRDFLHLGRIFVQQEIGKMEGLEEQANSILQYVESNWINWTGDFSVCGDYYRTSNINATVPGRVLRIRDSHKNSIYGLIGDIARVAEVSSKDILELQCGKKVQMRKTQSLSNENDIAMLTMALVDPFASPLNAVINLVKVTSLKIKYILLNQFS